MFEYNKISQDCWISRQSFEDFRSTCYLIGGPKGTEMEKCRDCNKINGGSCLYFNEAIENFVDINETNRYNTKGQRPEDLRSMIWDQIRSDQIRSDQIIRSTFWRLEIFEIIFCSHDMIW
jgi:hypothetical protein